VHGRAPARQRGPLERGRAPPADRVDGRARIGQPAVADHPLRRPQARARGPRRRDGAPARARRQPRRRAPPRAHTPAHRTGAAPCRTGAHKINNVLGQALLAGRMKKRRVIAETGAGQHGVATATAAALLGLECEVYMGAEDIERQALNVFRMRLLGARVIPVDAGSRTLKDAINEALRDWVTNVRTTYYLLGSALG